MGRGGREEVQTMEIIGYIDDEQLTRAARAQAWGQLKSSLGTGDSDRAAAMALAAARNGGGLVQVEGSRPFTVGNNLGGTVTAKFLVTVGAVCHTCALDGVCTPSTVTRHVVGADYALCEAHSADHMGRPWGVPSCPR